MCLDGLNNKMYLDAGFELVLQPAPVAAEEQQLQPHEERRQHQALR